MPLKAARSHPRDQSLEEAGGGTREGSCIRLERRETSCCRAAGMQGRGQIKVVLKERRRPVSTDLRL